MVEQFKQNLIVTEENLEATLSGVTEAYSHFKLEITAVRGNDRTAKGTLLCQLGDLTLLGTVQEESGEGSVSGDSPMATVRANGPTASDAANANMGFTGYGALAVYGTKTATAGPYAHNVIYDGLSIKVGENTRLSYHIYPTLPSASYDYDHTSHYMAIDLAFSDGTYLSSLAAEDQNGFALDPVSQGESEALYTSQWNYIESNIGEVARGKTVTAIIVSFQMPGSIAKKNFVTYFDDITLENRAEEVYSHPSDYVSILRGTNNTKSVSRGITVPLVTLPNGFSGYTPANTADELLPYYYQESGKGASLRHITVNHTASPWLPDANWGVWQMMVNTSLDIDAVKDGDTVGAVNRAATYSHKDEIARAHYYSVTFKDNDANAPGVKMELTPTSHGAYTRFTYPEGADEVNLILGTDHEGQVSVKIDSTGGKTIVSGYSNYHQKMYVYMEIDSTAVSHKVFGATVILSFPKATDVLTMRLATSYMSINQAKKNLTLEIAEWDTFDSIYAAAQAEWDAVLQRVVPEGATKTQLVSLYSSLYRMYTYPILFSENTGSEDSPVWQYLSPYTGKVTDGKMYTVNGFWDTYRTEWPALTLLSPTTTAEVLDGLLLHYKDKGYLARWLGRTGLDCMMGTHSDSILADAYLKGLSFDYKTAFDSMLKNAATDSGSDEYGRKGNTTSVFTGYVPSSVSNGMTWTVEDYINDYSIALMASALAKEETDPEKRAEYETLSAYYENHAMLYPMLFNSSVGFFMGKTESGAWTKSTASFDPCAVDWWADYAETNAWNMAFSVVYDMNGLAALYGGREEILKKLDTFFSEDSEISKNLKSYTYEQRETRLGLSMYNNQVSLHSAYLYNYFGQPYKTQALTREILSRHYVGSEIGQGYPGDEDNGALSAFYVLSALGLYQVSLGSGEYLITSPLYDKVTLNLESGKVTIIAKDNSSENIYIQSCKVNGKAYDKTYLTYEMLTSGDLTVEYEMGATPSAWGTVDGAPASHSSEEKIPTYLSDLTGSKSKITSGDAVYTKPSTLTVYGESAAELKKLFDNTSATKGKLVGGESITVAFAKPSRISLVTLTSSKSENAPKGVTVEYSLDGNTWVKAAEKTLSLAWDRYTYPVSLESPEGGYNFLRLSFTGEGELSLAELELIGVEGVAEALPETPDDDTPNTPNAPDTSEPTVPPDGGDTDSPLLVILLSLPGGLLLIGTAVLLLRKRKKR